MPSRSTSLIPTPNPDELQGNTLDNIAETAQSLALTAVEAAAAVVDLAHRTKELNGEHLEAFVAILGACSLGQRILAEIEPDLLCTHVGPARFAGIERQTAHSAAYAVAELVLRAILGDVPSGTLPQAGTQGEKLAFDVPSIRSRLREIPRFDGVLFAEMVKQEAAEMKQTREAQRAAEDHAKAMATIDERHRTTRTKSEVSEICGVHPRTVDRWIKSGKLRCVEAEGICTFDIREIELLRGSSKRKGPAGQP